MRSCYQLGTKQCKGSSLLTRWYCRGRFLLTGTLFFIYLSKKLQVWYSLNLCHLWIYQHTFGIYFLHHYLWFFVRSCWRSCWRRGPAVPGYLEADLLRKRRKSSSQTGILIARKSLEIELLIQSLNHLCLAHSSKIFYKQSPKLGRDGLVWGCRRFFMSGFPIGQYAPLVWVCNWTNTLTWKSTPMRILILDINEYQKIGLKMKRIVCAVVVVFLAAIFILGK